jgi:hypothetical protein
MMKRIISMSFILMLLMFVYCKKDTENSGEDVSYGSSHNTGRNCLSCHSSFKLAGSVYNKALTSAYAGAKVKITSQANGAGTVLAALTSDNNGNFYTSSSLSFVSGVFISIEGSSGTVKYMESSVTSGACNSCHGSSITKAWIE